MSRILIPWWAIALRSHNSHPDTNYHLDKEIRLPINFSPFRVTNVLGQGMAGMVLTALGGPLLFCINGFSFLVSAVSELGLPGDRQVVSRQTEQSASLIDQIKQGAAYCRKDSFLPRHHRPLGPCDQDHKANQKEAGTFQ